MENKKTTFIKATSKDTIGTSGKGYLHASYSEIVAALGEPERPNYGDGKTRIEWWFKTSGKRPTIVTIYDYKDVLPVEQLDTFHVGGEGDPTLIAEFLKRQFREEQIELKSINPLQEILLSQQNKGRI